MRSRFPFFCILLLTTVFCAGNARAQQPLFEASDFYQSDKIIPIEIVLSEKDWDEISVQTRDFAGSLSKEPVDSPFTWVPADITIDGKKIENVGIRKKGFLGSLDNDRPSLKVRFDKYVDQEPVTGLTRMTLNNNKQDPGRVLQYFTYKMFSNSGTRSPRCGFAAVTVNGKYLGLYSNVESIRKPMLEHTFGNDDGALYEGTVADFFPDRIQRFEKKNKAAKTKHLRKLAELLAEDEIDIDELKERVDIDAFIRYWAMESLIGFWDSYCSNQNNYYLYRNPENDKFYFIPWGADSSLSKTTPLPPYRIRPRSVHAKAILPNKLYRIPEYQTQYLEVLNDFLDEYWNEELLLSEVDRLEAMLEPQSIDKDFGETMDKYRAFIKTRRKSIEREFAKGAPELKSREQKPIYFSMNGSARVTFSGKWYDNAPRDKSNLGEAEIQLSVDGKEVEVTDPAVYSEVSKWPNQGETPPATVVIMCTRKSDGKRLTIAATLPQNKFKPTGEGTTDVGGVLIEGMNFGDMQWLSGSIQLDDASMAEGAAVKGNLEVKIATMKGLGEDEDDE
ncbi:MAG: hypothetical protein GY819_01425 [Planctomycetaceae bacterium]|nr:hypothetical protein [Planctomycetaceae bacterium]MCP4461439.1 hypothetical protein [Planctomycetaceae bacterium]MDG1808004.1 CotH kinase family protein [Pirellulaceae bacterium]MDG2105372.1 CotH kinase family protein [Pirellulaceae bacterium]